MHKFSSQDVPSEPGVYVFRNAAGVVIYVGKAKSLRKRLGSYFQPSRRRTADAKLRALINSISEYEVYVVRSEAEALLLESRLIKQYNPRYNVDLRDDKRYLLVAIDPAEMFPRLRLVRIRKDDGRSYYGPFPHARALRQTVDWLSRHFKLRTCNAAHPTEETKRHCLARHVRQCCCPCVGEVTVSEYTERVDAVKRVFAGEIRELVSALEGDMRGLAERQKFEEAARMRDIIANLRSVCHPAARRFARTTLATKAGTSPGVNALQAVLGLSAPPRTVECVDISNIGGTMAVGSVVCFRDGRPSSKDYRRFRIRSVTGSDDFAMMREVIERRYGGCAEGRGELPDLVVVDGGVGQLSAALRGLKEVRVEHVAVVGIAKQREEIVVPGQRESIILPRHHEGLKLIQALRDEAHRFALTYHQTLRRKRIANSILDEIEGIGPERRNRLLKVFRSVARIRQATPDEIAEAVPGIGPELARYVHRYLAEHMA